MVDVISRNMGRTVSAQLWRAQISQLLGGFGLVGLSALVGLLMLRDGANPAIFAWLVYFLGVVAIFYQPRYGVYLMVGFALVSDRALMSWYPFVKNFSSAESIFFVHDALIISPLESYIAFTFISWLGRGAVQRKLSFTAGPIFVPVMLFASFAMFGLVYGFVRGGDRVIALWEARAIFYLPALFVLTTNLVQKRGHVNVLMWIIAIALFIKGVFGAVYVSNVLQFSLAGVERIGEHSMSIHFNSLFVMAAAVWLYRDSALKRIALPMILPVVLLSYIANNRRASFLAMGVFLVVMAVALYHERRRIFWLLAPFVVTFGILYFVAFWNGTGALGAPVQAVKSVIGFADERDDSSNLYRMLENVNIMFTIRTVPLQGIGFGHKFFIVAPMADISFFAWWEYITHNSVMWIWMKTGIGGFLSMLLMVGLSIAIGTRAIWTMPGGVMSVAALTMTGYVFMHFIFAYVDMSWEGPNMIYVGLAIGLLNSLQRIAERVDPLPAKRWPWQPEPAPAPGPRPL